MKTKETGPKRGGLQAELDATRQEAGRLRQDTELLEASLLKAHQQVEQSRAEAVNLAARLHETREVLAAVWEAATDDSVPFYQRLPALRHLVPRVGAVLSARQKEAAR
jgi:chromosome segregation ATPase